MPLQGFEASSAKTLQSQNHQRAKIRFLLNGFRVVHGRLYSAHAFGLGQPGFAYLIYRPKRENS
jgi:hypothetical protein